MRYLAVCLALIIVLAVACGDDDEVPAINSPTPSLSASTSRTLTATATAAPTAPATPTAAPADTPAPTAVPTPAPTPAPPPDTTGAPATVLRLGNPSRRSVALTFDAGSDAGYTAMILDVLAVNGIKASFGMTGAWAEKYPDLLRRVAADGHTFINHSYDHSSFTGRSTGLDPLTQAARWEQLDRTETIIQGLAGVTTKPYFRPPFGDYDDSVNADVGGRGYAYNVMWTVDSRGWQGLAAPLITQRCVELAEPGAVYVFHVGSASQDGPALQSIIDGLRAGGYDIGGIEAVLG